MGKRESEWQVIRIRSKGEYLGTVKAPDEAAAVKAALKIFGLDKQQAAQLLLRQHARKSRLTVRIKRGPTERARRLLERVGLGRGTELLAR